MDRLGLWHPRLDDVVVWHVSISFGCYACQQTEYCPQMEIHRITRARMMLPSRIRRQ